MNRLIILLLGAVVAYVGSGYVEGLLCQEKHEEATSDEYTTNS